MKIRQDMGDAQGINIAGIGGNSVSDELHRDTTWNSGTVGGAAADFWILSRKEGGMHVSTMRQQIIILGKLWREYIGKKRGGDGLREPRIRSQGNSGNQSGKSVFWYGDGRRPGVRMISYSG